ncbi:MAG: Cof-type HAD-IIB family hydrolase [Prevotella sp.]|uniref:Cof-type HAD-IIB family hydrolase n=1 Tax=Prevotella sp. AGR2160 TaxID=1280674 RepID=UPI0004157C05|nr:Cof-type HAD-IIB family hydrolase [Prevotella sp. AGR2160]MDD5862983.1 Cof-type HAD-IIB family hydrolase [Prevotella sp.]
MIKALFFDIDGTLVSFKTHRIPQSTVDALQRAHDKGVKIFISTGRPVPFINNLGQIEPLIDGYITTTGAYCFIGDKVVCEYPMNRDEVQKIMDMANRDGKTTAVVGQKDIAIINPKQVAEEVFIKGLGLTDFSFTPLDIVLKQPILQVTPFFTAEEEAELKPLIPHCISSRWHPAFTDITDSHADKGKALHAMADTLGLSLKETAAFGDGGNDIPIIREAGIGVAMGNAKEDVKTVADLVTRDIDDGGIAAALNKLL